ncbi:hypothetical protein [Cytobacillus purgationiresistens]|uniref:Uncharacterized protein n=1 Tax=Cytobacillus purgationiresistens TaxID=863449 RepID=A0ABU0AR33_9BACI|nr:hypothetical protein [Cytobacillus purgationiresistens]MDQ0273729.1 hypothetical protein [Cytobacillus purgationiresistens]
MKWIWLSILIYFIGYVWDVIMHLTTEIKIEYIPAPHATMMIGIVLSAIAVLRYRIVFKDQNKWLMALNLIAVIIMTIGSLWDNFGYHIRGIEPAANAMPHLLLRYGGYLFLLLTIIISIKQLFLRNRNNKGASLSQ